MARPTPFGRAARWTFCIGVATVVATTPAGAVTYLVTKTTDTADGTCSDTDCSLREAVIAANSSAGADVVVVPSGVYELTRTSGSEDQQGDLDVGESVTIRVPTRATEPAVIETSLGVRLLEVGFPGLTGITATLRGLVFQGGGPESFGGAVHVVDGTMLTLELCEVRDSEASMGGGIFFEPGAQGTLIDSIVSGNSATTLGGGIYAPSTGTLSLMRSAVQNNDSAGYGGGLLALGTVTIAHSSVTGNAASHGGGLYIAEGTTTIVDSTIASNEATVSGGGVTVASGGGVTVAGTLVLRRSFVGGNQAVDGGGIHLFVAGAGLEVEGSTLALNTATGSGGGLFIEGPPGLAHISSSTVGGNVADSDGTGSGFGGGVFVAGGASPTFQNTILAYNSDTTVTTPSDCFGVIESLGHNLIQSIGFCGIVGVTDGNVLGVDPLLGALFTNGGPTLSSMPLAGSPAIDAGDPDGCVDASGAPIDVDQRGFPRHADDDADGVARCDIGAVERSLFSDGFESGNASRWSAELG